MTNRLRNTLFASILLLFSGHVSGDEAGLEVYKWVDDQGVTHYSSGPPPDRTAIGEDLEMLQLDSTARSGASEQDYFSVTNQAERLEASRLARERLRLEREKLRLQQAQSRKPAPVVEAPARESYIVRYPAHFGHFPHAGHRFARHPHLEDPANGSEPPQAPPRRRLDAVRN